MGPRRFHPTDDGSFDATSTEFFSSLQISRDEHPLSRLAEFHVTEFVERQEIYQAVKDDRADEDPSRRGFYENLQLCLEV